MQRSVKSGLFAAAFAVAAMIASAANAQFPPIAPPGDAPARGNGPQIYVTGQDLVYDSIVLAPLPLEGPFQKLEMGGPTASGLQTEFGPGDQGYVGGRWWVDANGDGEMDDQDAFFLCPLLGPGYEL